MDSATPPEFDCEFWAKPASNIRKKAHRLLKAMPTLLKVELLPTGYILNDVFDRSPRLWDVEIYLFPDEKKTERYSFSTKDKLLILVLPLLSENLSNQGMYSHSFRVKGQHAHLFEAMGTRNAVIKVNINGNELLICSSKLLDKTSQCMPTTVFVLADNFVCV